MIKNFQSTEFKLAVIQSLLGNQNEALEFLKESIDLEHDFIDRAKMEPDLIPIKDSTGYRNLLN